MWGCDGPSTRGGYWQTTCARCHGGDPHCPECEGEGEVWRDRCPASLCTGLESFAAAYLSQERGDGWPAPGSRSDQAAWYVTAREILDQEKARIQRAEAALAPPS